MTSFDRKLKITFDFLLRHKIIDNKLSVNKWQ